MHAANDNTAAKGLRGWWLTPPRPGLRRLINPWEYRHLRLLGSRVLPVAVRGRRGRRVPLVRRLRMGSLLPGARGAESGGWPLVPHYRSLRRDRQRDITMV